VDGALRRQPQVSPHLLRVDGLVDEAEMLAMRQIELERTYPPAHLNCYKKAGWK
jgi:hypothetical protein